MERLRMKESHCFQPGTIVCFQGRTNERLGRESSSLYEKARPGVESCRGKLIFPSTEANVQSDWMDIWVRCEVFASPGWLRGRFPNVERMCSVPDVPTLNVVDARSGGDII